MNAFRNQRKYFAASDRGGGSDFSASRENALKERIAGTTRNLVGIPTISTGVLDHKCNIHGENEYVSISAEMKMMNAVVELAKNWKELPK